MRSHGRRRSLCQTQARAGRAGRQVVWEYRLNPESRRDIEAVVHSLAARHLGQDLETKPMLLVPPAAAVAAGEYGLGSVRYPGARQQPFGLRESEWVQHAAVFGRTGSGKTNVGFLILRELQKNNKPFLVFDWKRNYRDLLTLPEFGELKVFTVGRFVAPFAFNPLAPPPGTQPTVWLKKLIEIICHVYWLGEGVAYLLLKAFDEVYRKARVYEGAADYPHLSDILIWLQAYKAKGREAQWMDSTLRAVGTLCYGEVGGVVNGTANAGLDELLRQRVVLELDALTNSDKAFLIESLLLWIHHYRLQEQGRETFKHVIVIEEAHHVLLKRKQSKETVMDVVFREIRELGEALVVLDQHPSLICIPSLGNTYCTIAMNLKHGQDVRALGDALQLSEEQRGYLGRLDVGTGIVRLQGRWHEPFLVQFPHCTVEKGSVSDEVLSRQFGGDSSDSGAGQSVEGASAEIREIRPADKGREKEKKELDEGEEALMEDVITHATAGVSERFRRLGWSVDRGYAVLDRLCAAGFLASARVSTPWGAVRFVYPTHQGAESMRQLGFEVPVSRNESPEHLYWKLRVAELLRERGFQVTVEVALEGGHIVDGLARRLGVTTAVEIETGPQPAWHRVRTVLDSGADCVLFVMLDARVANRMKRELVARGYSAQEVNVVTTRELLLQRRLFPEETDHCSARAPSRFGRGGGV